MVITCESYRERQSQASRVHHDSQGCRGSQRCVVDTFHIGCAAPIRHRKRRAKAIGLFDAEFWPGQGLRSYGSCHFQKPSAPNLRSRLHRLWALARCPVRSGTDRVTIRWLSRASRPEALQETGPALEVHVGSSVSAEPDAFEGGRFHPPFRAVLHYPCA